MLFALSSIFKTGRRELLLSVAPRVWRQVSAVLATAIIENNMLARKLAMKLLQRCALTVLDPTCVNVLVAAVRAEKKRGDRDVGSADDEVRAAAFRELCEIFRSFGTYSNP